MVSFENLLAARPDEWGRAADTWAALARESEDAANGIFERGSAKVAENWTDQVGAEAGAKLDALANSYLTAAGTMHGVVSILYGLDDSIGPIRRSLESAVDYARRNGFTVEADGRVTAPAGSTAPPEALREADALIREALDSATRIDVEARNQLDELAAAVFNTDRDWAVDHVQADASRSQVELLAEALPIGQDPATVAAWWNALPPQDRAAFERAVPVELYDLPGLPEDVKNRLEGDGGYNRVEAVRWAQQNAFNRDIDIFDNNCANFVSYALSTAGLAPKLDDFGGAYQDGWSQGVQTGWDALDARDYTHTPAWTVSDRQRDFFLENGGSEIPLSGAQPGDVIYWEQAAPGGPIAEGGVHHAAVVTSVTPDGDVHYTQHTASRLDASLDGRLPTNEVVEGDQRVVIVRPRQSW
ncbi:amidase domain-containing protein [Actinoplanes sp. NPDC048791]|uniref:amidase domain-containing protein n=1 Tax=Actinoplanes sp. NPDC048791 TaxID=3154623 RepID=UPI0033CA59B9